MNYKSLFNIEKTIRFYGLLTILIILVPIFGNLEKIPIRLWDESRNAFNAWEMSKSDNWWIITFEGQADMWNTKPPLLVWIQALMIKVFGLRPLSFRLPVAVAVFFTVMALFKFTSKQVGRPIFGMLVALVLITSGGYMCVHVARTGDFDGLLILFIVGYCISFFLLLKEEKQKYFYWFFILLGLAVLTKSIAGLLLLPGLGMYTLIKKKLIFVLKSPHFYFAALLFLLMVTGYYLTREHYNPGYLKAVYENEIGGRFLETLENHNLPFTYYLEAMVNSHFSYWLALAILGSCVSFVEKNTGIADLGRFATILAASFLLIISSSQTKLDWYDAPIYPFVAILAAIGILKIIDFIKSTVNIYKKETINVAIFVSLVALFAIPYYNIIQKEVIEAKGLPEEQYQYALSRYIIHNLKNSESALEGQIILDDEYIPQIEFYILMAQQKGINLKRKYSNEVSAGDHLLTQKNLDEKSTRTGLEYIKVYDFDGVKKYEVKVADSATKPLLMH
ncbi:MAG TPA: glycosyltransferase family 39 protein [Edaphocola sp.]|nr:glycosyltransferase family 39 protein [Edaphocola sp.]